MTASIGLERSQFTDTACSCKGLFGLTAITNKKSYNEIEFNFNILNI